MLSVSKEPKHHSSCQELWQRCTLCLNQNKQTSTVKWAKARPCLEVISSQGSSWPKFSRHFTNSRGGVCCELCNNDEHRHLHTAPQGRPYCLRNVQALYATTHKTMSYRAYKPLWQPMWISRQSVIATCMAQPTIAVRLPTSSTQAGLGNAIMEQTSQKTLQRPRGVTVNHHQFT